MALNIFHTVGCKLNQSETAQLADLFARCGITSPDGGAERRIVLVNTCAVTERAAAKSRHAISHLVRENPGAVVIATGCLAQHDPQSLAAIRGVDYVLGTAARFERNWWSGKPAETVIRTGGQADAPVSPTGAYNPKRTRQFLKIQDGCDQNCTYCIIPSLRGGPRSVSLEQVVRAAESLMEQGAPEIVLTGVRIGSWGSDLPGKPHLADLLNELFNIPGECRFRLGSLEPWELTGELIELAVRHPRLCPHLHIPLQHTSPRILSLMHRPPLNGTLERLHRLHRIHSDLALGVDLILGFPGEEQADFRRLVTDMERLQPAYLHAFSYSERPGTMAAAMEGKVAPVEARRRIGEVLELGRGFRAVFRKSQIGKVRPVVVERNRRGERFHGVTDNYIRVQVCDDSAPPGKTTRLRLRSACSGELAAFRP